MTILGITMPYIFPHEKFGIIENIHESIYLEDKGYLILAAFKMVLLNTIRAYPNYIAAFTFIESFNLFIGEKRSKISEILLGILIIPLIYFFINHIYGINYLFGKLTIITIVYLGMYSKMTFNSINHIKRMTVFLLFIMGIQWLDVTTFPLNFGIKNIGEISYDIRLAAKFIDGSKTLDLVGAIFFIAFLLFSFLLLIIFIDQEKMLKVLKDNQKINRELSEVKLKELENRYLKEVQYLVHDIKTPLFSIKTLIEILEIQETDENKKGYYKRIDRSIERCDTMISEMLKSKEQTYIEIEEVFKFIFSCLSSHKSNDYISYKNNIRNKKIKVNKIYFSRAIINLIINAFEAIDDKNPEINILVDEEQEGIIIMIEDNGKGIEQEDLNKIFELGYSTKQSSGIGLNFVKRIMDEHGYTFQIKKKKSQGSVVLIEISKGEIG